MSQTDTDVPLPEPRELLVHACCGPCLEYPARQMLAEGKKLTVFAYNPNIHPINEHQRRLEQLVQLTGKLDLTLYQEGQAEPEHWLNHEDVTESRCRMCYRVRLEATARKARDLGILYFTTTLLVSPYQDQELIIEIGHEAASRYGVRFYDRDFRSGYREGQKQAREDGLYRQRYCGCLLSIDQSRFKEQIRQELADLSVKP